MVLVVELAAAFLLLSDVDVAETFFSKVRILTRVPTHPFARFALTFPHRRARGRPNHAKLGKHVTSLFPRVP